MPKDDPVWSAQGWDTRSTLSTSLPAVRWPEEFESIAPPEQLIEDTLIADSLSLIFGPPKSGKTFWAIDLALHVAHGLPWNGRAVKKGLVLYAAGESPTGVMLRVKAWHKNRGLKMSGAAFALLPAAPDLLHEDGQTDEFIETIQAAANFRKQPARLVVIDTVHRALAGGNDNASEDMGKLVTNVDRVRVEAKAHVALIHHSGKDSGRGSRGSNSLPAAVGTVIEIRKDPISGARSAAFVDQRDLPDGEDIAFQLEVVELEAWDGKPHNSLVVAAGSAQAASAGERRGNATRLPDGTALLLRNIVDALADGLGATVVPIQGMVPVLAIDRKALRRRLIERGWFPENLLSDGKLADKGFTQENNGLRSLKRGGFLAYTREWAWLLS